ncbi:hypothetical protein EJ06DRAFT_482648 [Trichodelitschia bisporula]|uniref:SnoRNA binding protein-like protein n=1 Tax=Trichodelitschia bisporula TaxID=703511 RepID=A0A6G1HLV8_9PEZI|nr:hypothetical protein EJ06DRAFT_482648 [Trichodelitschia bisporula]
MSPDARPRLRNILILLRNLTFAALLHALILGIIILARSPANVRGKLGIPAFLDKSGPADILKTTKAGVKVKFAASSSAVTINPHANVFNRPKSAVVPHDDYLGPRPHVDTEADLKLLVEECRGTYAGLEKMRNVHACLTFLSEGGERYFHLPPPADRASAQDPHNAEYANADGHANTLPHYEPYAAPNKTSRGTCPGPIIPYHTYWTGPATWRLEIFVKSYLYTQNLACSQLNIWLDADNIPGAVEKMLTKDALFARFLPLVERGDVVLRTWKFPSRIPLPAGQDHTDGLGYYKAPQRKNVKGELIVADGIVEDASGQQWLVLTPKQMTFLPQAVSDAVRFVVLHLHGGAYFDMDVLLLRDMRPLLLPREHAFAERWAAHSHPGDYNTAVLSLSANSSLSSYLLRGGVRMGVNFHPRVVGRMAWKDGRDGELLMLETAVFDPLWTEFNWDREGRCTVPCLRDYGAAFKGKVGSVKDEWESYDPPVETEHEPTRVGLRRRGANPPTAPEPEPTDSFAATSAEEAELRRAGAIGEYVVSEDKFPANNRTLENFYRGSWSYHVHNQWLKHPEPSSWMAVIEHAHDGFFAGQRVNPYGERWRGPALMPYNYWPEYV